MNADQRDGKIDAGVPKAPKTRKTPRLIGVLAAAALLIGACWVVFGNPVVRIHNYQIGKKITALSPGQTVAFNELVPFAWDTVYTFEPYASRAEIEKIIGFRSGEIQETVSEGMTQLLFVNGKSVTASVCGYPDAVGYRVGFFDSVSRAENALFTVTREGKILTLTKQ